MASEDVPVSFSSPEPTPREEKVETKLSFEKLPLKEVESKTPNAVNEIIKLKQQEEAEESIVKQIDYSEPNIAKIRENFQKMEFKEKTEEKESDFLPTQPIKNKESSYVSKKETPRSPKIQVQSSVSPISRSSSKSSITSKNNQLSKTPYSSRTTPITSRTPDIPKKTPLLGNKAIQPKTSNTPRTRSVMSAGKRLSPIKSESSLRSTSRNRSSLNTAPSPSITINVSEREPTKDFEGLSCTPCENQDNFHEAVYWCRDCNEALCDACADHHKSLRMSKHHKQIKISEDQEMPFTLKIKENCAFHKNKKYEFFCSEHDATICAQCVTSTHKFCHDVLTIDEAAQKSLSFTDMKMINEKLKNWSQMVDKLHMQRARNLRELELQKSTIEKEIRKFRDDLVKHFDAMQQKSLDELAEIYEKNLKEIKRQSNALDERKHSLGEMQRDIKMMQNYASQHQVFLGTRDLKEKQEEEMKLLKVFEGQFNLVSLEFVVTNFMDLPLKVEKFGIVRSNVKPMPLSLDIQFDQKDKVKKQTDPAVITNARSKITLRSKVTFSVEKGGNFNFIRGGTILPDGRTVLLDHNNKCMIVMSPKGKMLDKITFYSCPWDICTLDADKVALTIPDKKEIVIMESKKFTLVHQIKVGNSCSGIGVLDGRIIVVSDKTGFVILDRMGTIASTIKSDVSGVRYVVAAFGQIYYTDFIRKTVNCIDINGNKIFRFQNDNLKYPCGITAIRDEFVLVTGYNSKNVIAVAADGKYHELILSHLDGLMYPTAIDYCPESSELMICTNRRGTVEIFETS